MVEDSKPVPDPTALTTEQLLNEIKHLRELMSSQIESLQELTDARFVTLRTVVDSGSEKVALALAAADKAVGKQEDYNNGKFSQIDKELDDLKNVSRSQAGRGAGVNSALGIAFALVAALGTIVSLFVLLRGK